MTFKNRIKDLRLEKELTQQALADALGISKQAISAYEQGNRKPGFEFADALAEFFGVSIGYLSGSSDERGEYPAARPATPTAKAERDFRILHKFRQLSPRDQELIENMMDSMLGRQ